MVLDNLILVEGNNTPEIIFTLADKKFSIKGNSFPENANKFYAEVLAWLDGFSPKEKLTFVISLNYISSSSIISILEVIRRLDKINAIDNANFISIDWYYDSDDEDIKKIGEDFQSVSTLTINLIANK